MSVLSHLAGSRRARRRSSRADDGITLIETVIALAIATAVFLALAGAAMTGLRASLTSQQNQQAGDVLTETMEQIRDMDYGRDGLQIANTDATLASDSRLVGCASPSGYCYNPQLGGSAEPLQVSSTGQITSHKQSVSSNHTTFTVWIYVTRPTAPTGKTDAYGADYERVTLVTTWVSYGNTHTRQLSSLITNSERGLPLPRYRFSAQSAQSVTVGPLAEVRFKMVITNLGARDCWNLTTSDTSFTLYLDNGDGVFDSTQDQPVAACPGTGSTLLEPTKSTPTIWAVDELPGTPGPYTNTVTFTTTSWAQPTAASATQTLTFSYSVVNGIVTPTPTTTTSSPSPTPTTTPAPTTCTDTPSATVQPTVPRGYSPIGYYLHNLFPNTADTTAQQQLTFDQNAPASNWLFDYSTDLAASTPGRTIQAGGSGATEGSTAKAIDWRLQLPQTFVNGTATFTAWAAPANGVATTHAIMNVYVNAVSSGGTVTPLSSATFDMASWACSGFRKFGVSLPLASSQKLAANTWLDVRIEVPGGASPMVLGYDTTAMPAIFAMPEK